MTEFTKKFKDLCKSSLVQIQVGNKQVVVERFARLERHTFSEDEANDIKEFYRILRMDMDYAKKKFADRAQDCRSQGLEHDFSIIEKNGERQDFPPDEECNRLYDVYISYGYLFDICRKYFVRCRKPGEI